MTIELILAFFTKYKFKTPFFLTKTREMFGNLILTSLIYVKYKK